MIQVKLVVAILILSLAHFDNSVRAEPSLAMSHRIDEVSVEIESVPESFTLLRDARDANLWYYVPNSPRLFERSFQGRKQPEFTLIRYQSRSQDTPGNIVNEGLLQFSLSLAIPPKALENLREQIATRTDVKSANIRLTALPLSEASVVLYAPNTGHLLGGEIHGNGLAPLFATQKMVFCVPITQLGADVFKTLLEGKTGLAVGVTMTFHGLSEAAGFKVSVDYEQAYNHLSSDLNFRSSVSLFGIFGGSADYDRAEMLNELTKRKIIQVEIIEGYESKAKDFQPYLDSVIARINQEVLKDMAPPETIAPAVATDPEKAKGWFTAGFSFGVKDHKDIVKSKETFSLEVREKLKRTTIAEGFIGLGAYDEHTRQSLMVDVKPGIWSEAHFVLPHLNEDSRIGVQRAFLSIERESGGKKLEPLTCVWAPAVGWTHRSKPIEIFPVGLLGLDPMTTRFRTKLTIEQRDNSISSAEEIEAFNSQVMISRPSQLFEPVQIDASMLTFRQIKQTSLLTQVVAVISSKDRSERFTLIPNMIEGAYQSPPAAIWLARRVKPGGEVESTTVSLRFKVGGEWKSWKHNGLLKQENGYTIVLEDSDWQ